VFRESPTKRFFDGGRSIAVIALFFVFLLPLHFHFLTPTAQIKQECSCYHGVRTQAGLASAAAHWTPVFSEVLVQIRLSQVNDRLSFDSYAIRAPPIFTSL
jgi:uncharacterized membrane protein